MSSILAAVGQTSMPLPATTSARLKKSRTRHMKERVIEFVLFLAAFVSVFTTAAIVYILASESLVFFRSVSIIDFLTDTQWTPLFDDAHPPRDWLCRPAYSPSVCVFLLGTAGAAYSVTVV